MTALKVKSESLPTRCEVCHQADCFDPATNSCSRCSGVVTPAALERLQQSINKDGRIYQISEGWRWLLLMPGFVGCPFFLLYLSVLIQAGRWINTPGAVALGLLLCLIIDLIFYFRAVTDINLIDPTTLEIRRHRKGIQLNINDIQFVKIPKFGGRVTLKHLGGVESIPLERKRIPALIQAIQAVNPKVEIQ